jgi:hypothetical protein
MKVEIQTCDPNSGFEVCVYPTETRRKRAQWVLWIASDGSGQLYVGREENGAVKGEPIALPPNVTRAVKRKTASRI